MKRKSCHALSHPKGNSTDFHFLCLVSCLRRGAAYCMYTSVWVIRWQQKSLSPMFHLHDEWQFLAGLILLQPHQNKAANTRITVMRCVCFNYFFGGALMVFCLSTQVIWRCGVKQNSRAPSLALLHSSNCWLCSPL